MYALDTNLLVRLATADNAGHARRVEALLSEHRCLVPVTVMLETEWVLRSRYAYPAATTLAFFTYLLEHPHVVMGHRDATLAAVRLASEGMDFADALHCALAGSATILSLDSKLIRKAKALGLDAAPLP